MGVLGIVDYSLDEMRWVIRRRRRGVRRFFRLVVGSSIVFVGDVDGFVVI